MDRTRSTRLRQTALACALLLFPTLVVYWPVTTFDFINLDDPDYVTANHFVTQGLTWPGILWAFHTIHAANWHPLTWLSLMLDVQLFGLHPGGPHLVNLLLHLANTLLLFFLLRRLTGALWRAAFVAALFALHPLHIESVAWISERKDVLSTCFGLLALLAYAQYVSKVERRRKENGHAARKTEHAHSPHSALRTPHSPFWYGTSLLLFACSLLSKPMLVTLPCLLLLLDFWPLQRFAIGNPKPTINTLLRLLGEKLPFLTLSALSSVITLIAQRSALASFASTPLTSRLAHIPLAYLTYIGKTFWPHPLAMFYPYRNDWSPPLVAAAFLLLLALTVAASLAAPRRPWFTVGWFSFLGLLVPVVGLVQVGGQAMADRYTYLPVVGLFIILAWGVPDLLDQCSFCRPGLVVSASAVLLACSLVARSQVTCWANTETLCRHALRVTRGNALAHACLGEELFHHQRFEEAQVQFTLALEANPSYCFAGVELGKTLLAMGAIDEAQGRLQSALRLRPDNREAHRLLAEAYSARNQPREARHELAELVRLEPNGPAALNNLAWLLATHPAPELRDGSQAVCLAERCCQLTGQTNLWLLSTLAAAYAETGSFDKAVATQQKVCSLAAASLQFREATNVSTPRALRGPQAVPLLGSPELLRNTQARLALYRSGHPYRQTE